jgi:hypothetical protein
VRSGSGCGPPLLVGDAVLLEGLLLLRGCPETGLGKKVDLLDS